MCMCTPENVCPWVTQPGICAPQGQNAIAGVGSCAVLRGPVGTGTCVPGCCVSLSGLDEKAFGQMSSTAETTPKLRHQNLLLWGRKEEMRWAGWQR